MGKPYDRESYRRELSEQFARVLEEQGPAWKKVWGASPGTFAPRNAVTGSKYNGINAVHLSLAAAERGFQDPRWMTMHQIRDPDGRCHPGVPWHLRKGSRAEWVEYWFPRDSKTGKGLSWDRYRDALSLGRTEREFFLDTRFIPVFNAAEVDGIPPLREEPGRRITEDALVRRISAAMGVPVLQDGESEAYYSASQDAVHVPKARCFASDYAFNATVLHELSHATGHPDRLNRPGIANPTPESYAREELVAEICACFLGYGLEADMQPESLDNHKAYVRAWLTQIRSDPGSLSRAIRDAQHAADYMDSLSGRMPERQADRTADAEPERRASQRAPERE